MFSGSRASAASGAKQSWQPRSPARSPNGAAHIDLRMGAVLIVGGVAGALVGVFAPCGCSRRAAGSFLLLSRLLSVSARWMLSESLPPSARAPASIRRTKPGQQNYPRLPLKLPSPLASLYQRNTPAGDRLGGALPRFSRRRGSQVPAHVYVAHAASVIGTSMCRSASSAAGSPSHATLNHPSMSCWRSFGRRAAVSSISRQSGARS